MRKVDIGRQGLRDILVLGELQSVVIGDGQNRGFGFTLYMSSDYILMPFANLYRLPSRRFGTSE